MYHDKLPAVPLRQAPDCITFMKVISERKFSTLNYFTFSVNECQHSRFATSVSQLSTRCRSRSFRCRQTTAAGELNDNNVAHRLISIDKNGYFHELTQLRNGLPPNYAVLSGDVKFNAAGSRVISAGSDNVSDQPLAKRRRIAKKKTLPDEEAIHYRHIATRKLQAKHILFGHF